MAIIYSKEQDGTLNVFVSGRVSREPERKDLSKGSIYRFSVCYGKKKYMDCEAWCDSDPGIIAGCLEKDDVVGVAGTHRSWEYNDKTYSALTADAIFTMSALPESAMPIDAEVTPQPNTSEENFAESADDEEELPF